MKDVCSSSDEPVPSTTDSKPSKRKRKSSSSKRGGVRDGGGNDDVTNSSTTVDTGSKDLADDTKVSKVVASTKVDNEPNENDDDGVKDGDDGELMVKKKRIRKRKSKRKSDDDCNTTDIDAAEANIVATDKNSSTSTATTATTDGSDEIDRTVYMEGIPFHATYEQIVDFLIRPQQSSTVATATASEASTADDEDNVTTKRTNIQRHEIIDIRLPIWQDTGRYRGYGHVVFTTKVIQQFALQTLHRQYFFVVNHNNSNNDINSHTKSNRYISISQAKSKRPATATSSTDDNGDKQGLNESNITPTLSEPSKTVILRNVSYQATEEDIYNALEELNVNHSTTNTTCNNTTTNTSFVTPTLDSGQIRIVRHTIPPYRSKGLAYVSFATIQDAKNCIMSIQQRQTSSSSSSSSKPFRICQRIITHYDYDHGRIKGSFRTAQHTFWSSTYGGTSTNTGNQQQQRSLKDRMSK